MNVHELELLKTRVSGSFMESPGGDLDLMLQDLARSLVQSGVFTLPVVQKTGGRSHLIEARCRPTRPGLEPATIADEVRRLWLEELCYADFEAHALVVDHNAIVLDFLTVARSARLYLTGMIVVDLG